ncbi:MAG: hypothetical protein JNM81_11690 [Rhodospirillaceae bacterium]|nr:hypothetical protein [Rhodospirillaceae bacterium]
MSAFILTSTSGWAATLMIVAAVGLTYLLRKLRAADTQNARGTYMARMQAHVWVGVAVLAATLIHFGASMRPELMRGANGLGLTLATVAVLVLVVQVVVGARLNRFPDHARPLRKAHFAAMLVLVALIAVHVLLNSPMGIRL